MSNISSVIRDIGAVIILAIFIPITIHEGITLYIEKSKIVLPPEKIKNKKSTSADESRTYNTSYKEYLVKRSKIYSYPSLIFGLFILILGFLIKNLPIGAGFILGGGLTIIMGYALQIPHLDRLMLFSSLILTLISLITGLFFFAKKQKT